MTEPAPETRLWQLMRGALAARALGIAAELGIADALADGPRDVVALAAETGADEDALRRVLRALASEGVFAEVEHGVFVNTEASDLLLAGPQREFAHLFGSVFHRSAAELDATSDEPGFGRAFGTDFWSWLAAHPTERASFDRAMVDGAGRRADRLAAVEWRGDETVVDVGGGNGSLLATLFDGRPGLRGIVLDLPETVRDEAALGDRIEFVAGSMFDGVPRGDAYVLGGVLHNWDDERAAAILGAVHAAAVEGARLLVLESVIPPGNEPHGAKWLDLLMLSLFAGRERDEAQWRGLLERAGFEPVRIEDGLIEAACR
jgi:O-methyltransferase domain/Dimerisation domain